MRQEKLEMFGVGNLNWLRLAKLLIMMSSAIAVMFVMKTGGIERFSQIFFGASLAFFIWQFPIFGIFTSGGL